MIRSYRLTFAMVSCIALLLLLTHCQPPSGRNNGKEHRPAPPEWHKPEGRITYHFEQGKAWLHRKDSVGAAARRIVLAVNRVDMANIASLDTVLVPDIHSGSLVYYLPFPLKVPYLEDVSKIIFFSYPTQTFGAYEYGYLVHAGPTNMGRKNNPTPPGLYFTNWKAEKTISTFDDEWELKWNFNVENKKGIGWHQYALPGYPASHSCLRLLEEDAKQLYNWANEWKLKGRDVVLLKGTPVVVFGAYPFGGRKPWLALKDDPRALDISPAAIEELVKPYMEQVLQAQEKRMQQTGEGAPR